VNLPQKVFLKAFYPQNMSQEFNLATFDMEDITLVTVSSFNQCDCSSSGNSKVTKDDAIIVVTMTNYVGQENVIIPLDCYYSASKVDIQNNSVNIAETLAAKFNNKSLKTVNEKPSLVIK
ncbi:18354_t:CDS:2, partial [Gigaspora margarita]